MRAVPGLLERTIIHELRDKIYEKNESAIVVFVGKTRIGKSLCCITFLKKIDDGFTTRGNCAFELDKFYEILARNETTECCVMCEEFGLKADKRAFATKLNRYIRQYFQVWAYKACVLAITVPSMSYIDSGMEPLIDYVFDAVRPYKRKVALDGGKTKSLLIKTKFKVFKYQHNAISGKTYKKHPIFWVNHKKTELDKVMIHAPIEEDINTYLAESIPYKDSITKEKGVSIVSQEEAERHPENKNNIIKSDEEIINAVLGDDKKYMSMRKGGKNITISCLMSNFLIGLRRASTIRDKILQRLKEDIYAHELESV